MPHEKHIILVPYWAAEAVRRHNRELSDLLDFEVVRHIFSAEDLAGLLSLQNQLGRLVGDPEGYYDGWVLSEKWAQTAQKGDSGQLLTSTVSPLAAEPTHCNSQFDRLFSEHAQRERDKEAFITYDLAPDVGAIVIYPGHFTSKAQFDLQFRALEAILKVLYVYNTYNEVSRTPWFRQYLVGLSTQLVAA